jgi:hypothetical protein
VVHSSRRNSDSAGARALNEAVAGATAATWDLARTASEPAARISRQVIDVATEREPNHSSGVARAESGSVLSLASLAPDSAAAAATFQQVGDRLAIGVRPLSATARHAFGFLFGAPVVKPEPHTGAAAGKGA